MKSTLLPGYNGCPRRKSTTCQIHSSRQMLKEETPANNNNSHWPYALESFPSEVCLCKSGIPGAGYGVCSRQFIPTGTWIGPYEGVKVKPDQVGFGTDASYMWEVHFIFCWKGWREFFFLTKRSNKGVFHYPRNFPCCFTKSEMYRCNSSIFVSDNVAKIRVLLSRIRIYDFSISNRPLSKIP